MERLHMMMQAVVYTVLRGVMFNVLLPISVVIIEAEDRKICAGTAADNPYENQ